MWQVREELATILCPDEPADCEKVDTGGYRVTTTLDWDMQKIAEKYVYAAARAPHVQEPAARSCAVRKIPRREWGWILNLRGRNIHNAASAVMDYRTGEVLAYVGSARYTAKGTKKFQPQFDVLSDGWRQPGSSIKPIDYAIGIDDETMTASTMFMDVDDELRRRLHADPGRQARARPGPRCAARSSSRSTSRPSRPRIIQGLEHTFERSQDFGLRLPAHGHPGHLDGHRHARDPPDRHARRPTARSPTAACGCRAS